jgi:hypothetical protein
LTSFVQHLTAASSMGRLACLVAVGASEWPSGIDRSRRGLLDPPAINVNAMPQFLASFNLAPKPIRNGSWARQITVDGFNVSTTISGVDMRLGRGAFARFIGTSKQNGPS